MKSRIYIHHGAFRLALALLVLLSHTVGLPGFELEFLSRLQLGNIAVLIFFVVSGFLMTSSLETIYSGSSVTNFLFNRMLRIYPQLLFSICLSLIIHFFVSYVVDVKRGSEIVPDFSNAGQINYFSYLIFSITLPLFPVNDKLMHVFGVRSPLNDYEAVRYIWAIYVELIFYYIIALYFYISRNFSKILLIFFKVTLITLSLVAILLTINASLLPEFIKTLYIQKLPILQSFVYAPFFAVGCSLYYYFTENKVASKASLVLFLICSICFLLIKYSPANVTLVLLFFIFCYAFYKVLCAHYRSNKTVSSCPERKSKKYNTRKVDELLGGMSYPIYLNHYALTILVLLLWDLFELPDSGSLRFSSLILFIFCVGYVVARLDILIFARLRAILRGSSF